MYVPANDRIPEPNWLYQSWQCQYLHIHELPRFAPAIPRLLRTQFIAQLTTCEISRFHRCVVQVFALLGCYAAYMDSCSPTFRDLRCPETSANNYKSTLCTNPEERFLKLRRRYVVFKALAFNCKHKWSVRCAVIDGYKDRRYLENGMERLNVRLLSAKTHLLRLCLDWTLLQPEHVWSLPVWGTGRT